MWSTILASALLLAAPQQSDTTFAVDPKARLRMEGMRGDVEIHTWDRPEIRVQSGDLDEDVRLRVSAGSATVTVGVENRRGGPASADLELTIPATMEIALTGASGDVEITGARGAIGVQTVRGDIQVRGGAREIRLQSVQGDIALSDASGRVEVHAVNGDIALSGITGDVVAETGSGDISLERVDAAAVDATTVSGDVSYDGSVKDGGRYNLRTHSGDVTFGMPRGAGAVIGVNTFNGEFESDIPVQLTEQSRGRRFSFTLGSGAARVELESFSGDIRLASSGFGAGKQ